MTADQEKNFDFDFDRSTADGWREFTERLAEIVSVMDDTAPLTIGAVSVDEQQVPFVTFRSLDRDTIEAQAASNAVLGERSLLRAEQLAQVAELGWQDPNSDPSADAPLTPNFWVRLPQEDSDRLAALAVGYLQQVQGIQHPAFLAPDQLAEILTPRPTEGSSEFDAEDVVATIPVNSEHLADLVEQEVTDLFGHSPLHDTDGDLAIRVGSTMVFVRVTPDGREVIVFSCLVHDVAGRSRAMEVLNDLNADARVVKFQLIRDRVFVTYSLLAHPFVPAHLHQAVQLLSDVADGIDEDLASKLEGRTTFEA